MVLAAAAELLEHGYAGSSLARIAGRIDLTKGALAYHFPTKVSLLGAVIGHLQGALEASHAEAMAVFPQRGSRVCVAQMAMFGYTISTDAVAAAAVSLFADPSAPEGVMAPILIDWHRMISGCFEESIEVEGVRLVVPTPQAAEFFIASMAGSILTARFLPEISVDRDRLKFTELTLQTLGFPDAAQIVADVLAALAEGKIDLSLRAYDVYDALRPPTQVVGDEQS